VDLFFWLHLNPSFKRERQIDRSVPFLLAATESLFQERERERERDRQAEVYLIFWLQLNPSFKRERERERQIDRSVPSGCNCINLFNQND
jgi:hypothetical protein